MRRTRFDDAPCPIARTTDVMGDWWTPIVMREAFFGCRRFEEFQDKLGLSRATLTQRLTRLVDEDFLTRVPYQDNPPRYEYRLTDKGRAFFNVLAAMWRFGEDWLFEPDNPPPLTLARKDNGDYIRPVVVDANTGEEINVRELRVRRRRPSPTAQSSDA
jgi:DNA-binding HxlR family transcriptional regulator